MTKILANIKIIKLINMLFELLLLSNLFAPSLKDEITDLIIPSQSKLFQAGFVRKLQNHEILHLPYLIMIYEHIELQLNNFLSSWTIHHINTISTDFEFYNQLFEMEIKSYKQLPVAFTTKLYLPNLNYQVSKGLFYPKHDYILSYEFLTSIKSTLEHLLVDLIEYFEKFNQSDNLEFEFITSVNPLNKKITEAVCISGIGDEKYIYCENCGYKSNRKYATFDKNIINEDNIIRNREIVHTPGTSTIEQIAEFLDVPQTKCGKIVFHKSNQIGKIIVSVIRGDLEINKELLEDIVGSPLQKADHDEIISIGAYPGFASPIGIDRENTIVVVDDSILRLTNIVMGTNKADYHYTNINYPRDFKGDIEADIALTKPDYNCMNCEEVLSEIAVVKWAEWFQNSSKLSIQGVNGKPTPIHSLRLNIFLNRLLSCVADYDYDDYGLIFSDLFSPFQVNLIEIANKQKTRTFTEEIYQYLQQNGISVLYDDRDLSPGIKFAESDLRGIPIRMIISDRLIEDNLIELKSRKTDEIFKIEKEELLENIENLLK